MSYLSAGVYVKEIDNSAIVPTVSNSVAFFAGNFTKGVIEQPFVITNKEELEYYFGQPTNETYNEWFQCSKFFDYANQLVISRAFTEGNPNTSDIETLGAITGGTGQFDVAKIEGLYVGIKFNFETFSSTYEISDIQYNTTNATYLISIVTPTDSGEVPIATKIIIHEKHQNAGIDAYQDYRTTNDGGRVIPNYNQDYSLYKNESDFDVKKDFIPFGNGMDVKLKFIAKTAGEVEDKIEFAICNSFDFNDHVAGDVAETRSPTKAQAFEGVPLRTYFEYPPVNDEIGVVIRKGNKTESFICSFDESAVDGNNKSMYIENVVNDNSTIVYVVDNSAISTTVVRDWGEEDAGGDIGFKDETVNINSYLWVNSQNQIGLNQEFGQLETFGGEAPYITSEFKGDIKNAYDEVLDKEQFEIDVVIGNEVDLGVGATELANNRADCIAFVGARYEDVVGKKSAVATANLEAYMRSSEAPLRTMFSSFFGNYVRIFDNYGKKYRWINIAGDCAGLRSNTNSANASWWASAGLRRGVIRNIDKLAFSPSLPQRDVLYVNNINPIVAFPGEGNLVWGQKTLLNYSSSFDRINVRGLFNTIERAMAKASRSSVFEFNDPFTRNSILAMFNPYLSSVKAGRGISDFLVICDETNNTPDIISRNELHVDIYIKPNYSAEFIQLTFNNVGTRSFSSVIGA